MRIFVAQPGDIAAWLCLAAEVEPLFGPMVNDPGFHRALRRNIERGTAFCVREDDGPPGASLLGGILLSPKLPLYTIGWLAVTQQSRRRVVGRLLVERVVERVVNHVQPPAEIVVTTFGPDAEEGQPARRFYESIGFYPTESAPDGPEDGSRQVYQMLLR